MGLLNLNLNFIGARKASLLKQNKWYGVRIDESLTSPDITRIAGDMSLHSTLPVHSELKACILSVNGTVNYYLNPTDWTKKIDGTASKLDGTDGNVMIEWPNFYYKVEPVSSGIYDLKISLFRLSGYKKVKQHYTSAYEAALNRADLKLVSVKNNTTTYRGGNNDNTKDALESTLLCKPVSNINRTDARTYARATGNGYHLHSYDNQQWIAWFFAIEYGTLNTQKLVQTFIQDLDITATETEYSSAYDVDISSKKTLVFKNNKITSVNTVGYLINAGTETSSATDGNLDGAFYIGNKLTWNGDVTNPEIITHGIFTAQNSDNVIKYNYLDKLPYAIIFKSSTVRNNSVGGAFYNIFKTPNAGVIVKGINGIKIYNNTFYQSRTVAQTNFALVKIYKNVDGGLDIEAKGTKIKNNIFYTKYLTNNIEVVDNSCLTDFESDYNVFYCEAGEPLFKIGSAQYTFTEWQALGYDEHSVIVNPNFIDTVDFIPTARLDYGTDLGAMFAEGLHTSSGFLVNMTSAIQDNNWQVGARIYGDTKVLDIYKQGGLGIGITTVVEPNWTNFNGRNPFISCGASDALGSGSGEVEITIPTFPGSTQTFNVPRYRGHENIFGHLLKGLDGANLQIQPTGGKSYLWLSDNPSDWNDTDYTNYENRGEIARAAGKVSKVLLGENADWATKEATGTDATYYCDDFGTTIPTSEDLYMIRSGNGANGGTGSGLFYFNTSVIPSLVFTTLGYRLSYTP